MEEFDFTEDEIQEQLHQLGYYDVPRDRLRDFKKDLEDLIKHEKSRNSSWSTVESGSLRDEESDVNTTDQMQNGHHYGVPHSVYPSYHTEDKQYGSKAGRLDVHMPKPQDIHIHQGMTDNEYSLYSNDETHPKQLETSLDTTTSTERRVMKRKVLRKIDGRSQVFDESTLTESDLDDVSRVEERLRALPLSEHELQRPTTAPSGQRRRIAWGQNERPPTSQGRPQTAKSTSSGSTLEPPCYRLPDDYLGPKALIRPMTVMPNEQIKKSDPVSKHQQYRHSWKTQRAPGEKNHKNLRWNVREQMLYHDEVLERKPTKVFVPNNYKVPTDKKRKNLRWHIKMDLAQGVVPPSMYN